MSQSLVQIYLHLVFSTKHRDPFLKDPELRQRVHAYLAGICKNLDCPSLKTGGVEDHVHILMHRGEAFMVGPRHLLKRFLAHKLEHRRVLGLDLVSRVGHRCELRVEMKGKVG